MSKKDTEKKTMAARIRNAIRNGVMTRTLVIRENSVTGVMSPYPVVDNVTAE